MLPIGNGTIDQSALETLAQVKLQQFSATPAQIEPFGESTVRWTVSGPSTGFTVTLNSVAVARSGSQLVQPVITTAYTLAARAGPYTRPLGSIAVQVDLDACQIIPQPATDVRGLLSRFIASSILSSDSLLYFRTYVTTVDGVETLETYTPEVTFLPGLIQIVLHLGSKIKGHPHFPDASIDVTIIMGLAIVNGSLQAGGSVVTGTVSEPWWVYLLPGAIIGLGIALSDAEDSLPMKFAPLVDGIAEFIALAIYPVGEGMKYQNVMIQADPTTAPIQLTACPVPISDPALTGRSVSSIDSILAVQQIIAAM